MLKLWRHRCFLEQNKKYQVDFAKVLKSIDDVTLNHDFTTIDATDAFYSRPTLLLLLKNDALTYSVFQPEKQ